MKAITISDYDPAAHVLTFDLKDVLALLGDEGKHSIWTVGGTEALGESAEALHAADESGRPVPGTELEEIAQGVYQTIEGEFRAYATPGASPWVILRAVDSSLWEIETDREDILARFRERFREVRDVDD